MMTNKIWDYIDEQPEVLENIILNENLTKGIANLVVERSKIVITASGSSLNAALEMLVLLKDYDLDIRVIDPFDYRFNSNLSRDKHTTLLCLSQTGKSVGTLECILLARKNGIKTISFTSNPQSEIALAAEHHVDIMCKEETVGPKTKGFTATVLMLHLFLLRLVQSNELDVIKNDYLNEIRHIQNQVTLAKEWCNHNKNWATMSSLSVVGYGFQNAIAREGSLKILETMQIPVMNYNLEEFMHGPHRTITKDSFLVFIHSNEHGHDLMEKLISFAFPITKQILVLSNTLEFDNGIKVLSTNRITSWISFVVILQVLCSYWPELNGVNPSDPIYGSFAKTVGTRL